MKYLLYSLALALLSSGGLYAATTTKKVEPKTTKYKKITPKKQTYAKKETVRSSAKDRYGKQSGSYRKMDAKKHEKGLSKPTTKKAAATDRAVASAAKDRPSTLATTTNQTQPSMLQRAERWLGLGAAGAAATKAAGYKTAGYHTGPQKERALWESKFGKGWGPKEFVEGTNEFGHWTFAKHRPDWWEKNFPIYWKDVVGPLYRKTTEYQQLQKNK